MMVTVAKSLDVPIKLMFPRPAAADDPTSVPSHAMLGLGDVVLPGIMIGLALRFDLYLFYLRRQKPLPAVEAGVQGAVEKPKYFSLAGRWSDHFWTHSLTGRPLWNAVKTETETEAPFTFPKTYFNAGLVGYILGLLATLGVMMVWNHAQPALLYLVPGVLGSIWLTALVRGELNLMWNYTEEIEEEGEEQKTEDTKPLLDTTNTSSNTPTLAKSEENADHASQAKRVAGHRSDREVFSFSILAPWQLNKAADDDKAKASKGEDTSQRADGEKQKWAPSVSTVVQQVDAEPAGKRMRLK